MSLLVDFTFPQDVLGREDDQETGPATGLKKLEFFASLGLRDAPDCSGREVNVFGLWP